MSKPAIAATLILAAGFALAPASEASAQLPNQLNVGESKLVLNGSGARTKYLMQLYVAGLYLADPSADAAAIIAADAPMSVRLHITSGMVTQEKLVASLNEGFDNSTGGETEPLHKEIDDFRRLFAAKITKGDVFDLVYLPEQGVIVLKNGKRQGAVPGLAFKQALFGIWLGEVPADEDLKLALLEK
jgi:hypothetical protein